MSGPRYRRRKRIAPIALTALLAGISGCATSSPATGPVIDAKQARAIARDKCDGYDTRFYDGQWQARLAGHTWFAWKGDGRLQLSIDARDGSTQGCVVVTR